MTSTQPVLAARPTTPGSIVLARVLVTVQVALGLVTSVTVGFLAVLGLAWSASDGGVRSALALVIAATFVACLGVTIAVACLAGALRHGARQARTALLAVESVLAVAGLAFETAGGWSTEIVAAPGLFLGCAVATIVALSRPTARNWCQAPR